MAKSGIIKVLTVSVIILFLISGFSVIENGKLIYPIKNQNQFNEDYNKKIFSAILANSSSENSYVVDSNNNGYTDYSLPIFNSSGKTIELANSQTETDGIILYNSYYSGGLFNISFNGYATNFSNCPADGYEVYLFLNPLDWNVSPQYNWNIPYYSSAPFNGTEFSPVQGNLILPFSKSPYVMLQWDPFWLANQGTSSEFNLWIIQPEPQGINKILIDNGIGQGGFVPSNGNNFFIMITYDSSNGMLNAVVNDISIDSNSTLSFNLSQYLPSLQAGNYAFGIGANTGSSWGTWYISPPNISERNAYNVTFQESGLPQGASWFVTLNGITETSTNNTIIFKMPNGTYSFKTFSSNGYDAYPSSGNITINGNNVNEIITFKPPSTKTYIIRFKETGLPSGTFWLVMLNGVPGTSTTNTIMFNETNGTYTYSVASVNGYIANQTNGTVNINGKNVTISLTFSPEIKTYIITFTESGLPSGTSWSVTLDGFIESSITNTITFNELNGTYTYTIGNISGWYPSVYGGSLNVNGKNIFINITFKSSISPKEIFYDNFWKDNYLNTSRWIFDSPTLQDFAQDEKNIVGYNITMDPYQLNPFPPPINSNGLMFSEPNLHTNGITSSIKFAPPFNITVNGSAYYNGINLGVVFIYITGGTPTSSISIFIGGNQIYVQYGYGQPVIYSISISGESFNFQFNLNVSQNYRYNYTILINNQIEVKTSSYFSFGNGQGFSLTLGQYIWCPVGTNLFYETVYYKSVNVTSTVGYNPKIIAIEKINDAEEIPIGASIYLFNKFSFVNYTSKTNNQGIAYFNDLPQGTYILTMNVSQGENYLLNSTVINLGNATDPYLTDPTFSISLEAPPPIPLVGSVQLTNPNTIDERNLTMGFSGLNDTFIAGISGGVENYKVKWYTNGILNITGNKTIVGSIGDKTVENFILEETFYRVGNYTINFTVNSTGEWYNVPMSFQTNSQSITIHVLKTPELLTLQPKTSNPTTSVSFNGIPNQVLAWVTNNKILLNANISTSHIGIPIPAWLMNILGFSNPWYGLGINDSAGSEDFNYITSPGFGDINYENISLPDGTPSNLEGYDITFDLNPTSEWAIISDLVIIGFALLGVISAIHSPKDILPQLIVQLVESAASNIASLITLFASNTYSFNNIASEISNIITSYGTSMLYSLANFIFTQALGGILAYCLSGVASSVAAKLGLDSTGIGIIYSVVQLVIDAGIIIDAIVQGTLYTTYQVINIQHYNSIQVSDPSVIPDVYLIENGNYYGYNNGWTYPSGQFFMHSSNIDNGYSFIYPDPENTTLIIHNPSSTPINLSINISSTNSSISIPVSIGSNQTIGYNIIQTNTTIEATRLYKIEFKETGFLSGTSWSVTLNNMTKSSINRTIIFNMPNGSYYYTIMTPINGSSGVRYITLNSSGTVTVNGTNATINVSYETQYYLTMVANPLNGGSLSPASGWYKANSTIKIVALPNSNFEFFSWLGTGNGSYSGPNNPAAIKMKGPIMEKTIFIKLYEVTFLEIGLQVGTAWYVKLSNGESFSCTGTAISFQEPNGTYSYTIATVNKNYAPAQSTGTFTVNGTNVSMEITFNLVTYTITFTESGLPSGTAWYVLLDGITKSSSNNTIIFNEPNGSYSYSIESPLSGGNGIQYVSSVSSGSITVNGSDVRINIPYEMQYYLMLIANPSNGGTVLPKSGWFNASSTIKIYAVPKSNFEFLFWSGTGNGSYSGILNQTSIVMNGPITEKANFAELYSVTFFETGLPSGTIWFLNLSNGKSYNTTGNSIEIQIPNGSYSYTIGTGNKEYAPTQYSGSFTVNGAPASESITFNLVTYKITFSESGLSAGTTWYVTLNGITKSSSNNTIIFNEPNGSYYYTIQGISGYRTTNYSGSITVNGNSANENFVWSIILYPITITENGIPNGTAWSATLAGKTFNGQYINVTISSTTNKITFNEPNGTYSYIIHLPSGYQSTNTKGPISVSGNSVLTSIAAQQTNNYFLIGIIAVIVIIAIVAGIIFMRKGKHKNTLEQEKPKE